MAAACSCWQRTPDQRVCCVQEVAAGAAGKGGLLSSFVRSIGLNVVGTQVGTVHQPSLCPRPASGTVPCISGTTVLPACKAQTDVFSPSHPTPVQALTRGDIQPALATLKRKLMERNVAEEIADKCVVVLDPPGFPPAVAWLHSGCCGA